MTRCYPVLAILACAALAACAGGDQQAGAATDTTARDLTLAPTDTAATLGDPPAADPRPPATRAATPASRPTERPPAARPRPAEPTRLTAVAGTTLDLAVADTISSRTNKAGDSFTARVVEDVKDATGRVVIPAGSTVRGTVAEVKPAPNPSEPGTLTLAVSEISVRGTSYPLDARIDSLETVRHGRGVTTGDAAKVGAGAAAGAILGRVVGGNKKGTIIGGVVGGAVGAAVAASSKDADIVLPAGAHVVVTITKALMVAAR